MSEEKIAKAVSDAAGNTKIEGQEMTYDEIHSIMKLIMENNGPITVDSINKLLEDTTITKEEGVKNNETKRKSR